MKNLALLLLTQLILFGNCLAQDVIYKKDNTKINCKVLKISEEVIEYKKEAQLNGPIREISISKVNQIIYEDGAFEIFKLEPQTNPPINKNEVFFKINNKRTREKIRKFSAKSWLDKDKNGIAIEKVISLFKNEFKSNGYTQELSEENSKFILNIDISEIYYILNNVFSPVTIEQLIAIDISLIEKDSQETLYKKSIRSTSKSKMKVLKKNLKRKGLEIKTFKKSTFYNIFSVSTQDLVNELCLDPKFHKYFNL